ncbi:MAG: zinc-ribbon domain-containing protein [Saccharospirillaceae bacterium]|nr:zinc-ribbon domain-containing protein [Saccharospirillaceae bacterium]MCD8529777.1 zinc-ribbon domain-containing protein [Saccharospirillaceae bacterium]
MAVHVTRCPHCQTSFRVRDEHLSAARGMVRCGSCLQVFKAAEHFIQENTPVTVKSAAPQTVRPAAPVRPAAAPAKGNVAQTSASKHDPDDDDPGLIHDDMDDDPISETLADDPFTDFNLRAPDHQKRPKPRIELEMDDTIFSLRNVSSDTIDFRIDDDEGKSSDDDESWANALLNDDDDSIRQMKEEKVTSAKLKLSGNDDFNFDLPPPEEDDFHGFLDDDDDDHQRGRNDFTLGGDDGLQTETLEISLPVNSIAGLQEEPLQLTKKQRDRTFPWGWFGGVILMLFAAAAQTLYFQFDHWARTPQWRPYYAHICGVMNCQLPKIQNTREMTTQHLVVRAHPDLQRALVVDTLLLNKATYEQPFPDLTLVFRDLNDNIVASRQFSPEQYLSGELAGQNDMPSQAPIHIALEIVDPGPEAVSYAIQIVSNQ